MGKWIAEFDLEDGDIMPEHMDLEYKGVKIDFHCKPVEQEPTTKNDLAQERYQDLIDYFGDKEVAKTILEDKKEFKAWLERLRWNVKRADELARELEQLKGTTKNDLGVDKPFYEQMVEYCNEHFLVLVEKDVWEDAEKALATKNDLGVDADKLISDCEKMSFDIEFFNKPLKVVALDAVKNIVKDLPSVTPQEPKTFKWCTDCKEYDQEKHCCHRWSKVIRDTVEEMKQEQESVIDKIRAEIDTARFIDKDTKLCKNANASGLEVALKIIDKHKAESDIEKRKPCINCEDGCEEWAGCPCVYYKAESEKV